MTFPSIKLDFSNLLHPTKWSPSGLKNECVHPTVNAIFSALVTIPLFAYFNPELSLFSRKKNFV